MHGTATDGVAAATCILAVRVVRASGTARTSLLLLLLLLLLIVVVVVRPSSSSFLVSGSNDGPRAKSIPDGETSKRQSRRG